MIDSTLMTENSNQERPTRIPVRKEKVIAWNRNDVPDWWEDIEIDCPGCRRKYTHTAQNQARWYETEQRPLYIASVRCRDCAMKKTEAQDVCRRYEAVGLDDLTPDEMTQWLDAIVLLKQSQAKYNCAMLQALIRKLDTHRDGSPPLGGSPPHH
jgi:hypothetical protein